MRILFSVLFGIFSCISFAQTYPDKPKIIVHVVVEQLRYDYLTRFSSNFGRQGFLKIMQEGTVCTNVHVPFAHAESASAYASISTGA
ncbi:MAG TPA: alkaline phosphatase family protein, partial [Bacteroidales bacterium]|nr:alkaline phosphatase family protein [Bacteroidales bacterium]